MVLMWLCSYNDGETIEVYAMGDPHTHVNKNTTKTFRFKFHGIFEM